MTISTQTLLRDLAEALEVLHRFARDEQAKNLARPLISPAADARFAELVAKALHQANLLDANQPSEDTIEPADSPRG